MTSGWSLLGTEPDEFADPAGIGDRWAAAVELAAPVPIGAAVTDGSDLDARDWWLRSTLEMPAPGRLEFGGLTCPGTVFVDGRPVAEVESMFLPVTVPVDAGTHELVLRFGSLTRWLRTRRPRGRWRSTLVAAQGLRWWRGTLLGRAPVYGGGRLPPPIGVWRPLAVSTGGGVHGLRVRADPVTGEVRVRGRVDAGLGGLRMSVRGPAGDELAATDLGAGTTFDAAVVVPDPQPWWPRGYGRQPCYRLSIAAGERVLADRILGFRSVVAERGDDGFVLRVNGVAIFARGVAWVPPDPVGLTVDADRLRRELRVFADAGATLVRVVGGLVPEQAEFYELCAELGLLVWQDAMQATFDPPDEIGELICRESASLLDRLSGNPCLAVVSGGSETEQQPELLGVAPDRRALALLTSRLPAIVAEHGGVPYVTSSPSSPAGQLAIRPDVGVAHWFGVGGYLRPLDDVRTAGVRFAAESLAFAIPPEPAAVDRHFGSAAHAAHHPEWKAGVPRDRTASWDFEDVRDHYVREIFGVDPAAVRRVDPERYLELGRAAVAAAMSACYAFWRSDPRCGGALVLSGRDLLPGAGWGLLDSDGAPKLPLAALARSWAPVAVLVTDAGLSGVRIDVHNDTPQPLAGTLRLRATDALGNLACTGAAAVEVGPRSTVTLRDSELTGRFTDLSHAFRFGPPVATAVEVTLHAETVLARDALVLVPAAGPVRSGLRAVARDTGAGWVLELSAETALRHVRIDVPGWRPADTGFALPAGLPCVVELRPDGAAAGPPRGRVSSVDALDPATIVVAGS